MAPFPSKPDFLRLGTQKITPSTSHASQDCYICNDPLAIHPHTTQTPTPTSTLHPALRITACSHILGVECLSAWLNTSNTCPICSRMLFEKNGQSITQEDMRAVVRALGYMYGVRRVMGVLARRVEMQVEGVRVRMVDEEGRRREVEKEVDYAMEDGEWVDSEGELDIGEDEDEEGEFDADEYLGVDEEEDEEGVMEGAVE
ncbi:hypothetical protein T440DRAFT_121084 [Plenodomus tracheiphilus IPT5]|uniref:RING-type domain-containing protein n=1 Tax=Plenodomus tracheiphilus IPT5 TaxID=1408161 RepID=A0A6A7B6H5_9PLEO|nr:hypothetical protein T440DRAFT_121084 [Plenodomus tracheiphilus IPT5]